MYVLFLYLPLVLSLPFALAASITPTFLSRRSLPRGNRPDKFALAETFDSCDEFGDGRVGGELNCRLKLRGSYITEGRRCSGPPSSLPLKANSDPNLVINVREKRHEMGDIVKLELSGTIDPREDGHADRQTRGWSPSQSLSKVEASRAQWLGRIGDPPRPRSSYSLLSYSPFCCIKLD